MKAEHLYMKRSAGILLCLLTLFVFTAREIRASHTDRLYFNHLKASNSGLSYDCVYDIIQDAQGFIWMATPDGLNRYDGSRFRTYRKEETGLNTDFVISLCEDDRGDLWVGTDCGVSICDAHTGRFIPFDRLSDQRTSVSGKVISISKDREGTIWMAVSGQGLFSYCRESDELKNYFVDREGQTLPSNISAICFDSDGVCWISAYFSNLYRADKEMKTITPVSFPSGGEAFRGDNVVKIVEGHNNALYVATANLGVCEISPQRDRMKVLISNSDTRFTPEKMFLDRNCDLWISTMRGVYVYNTISGRQRYLCMDKRDQFSLSDNRIHTVFIDNADGVWVGTHTGGVSYAGAFQKNFDKYYSEQGAPLTDCMARGFAEDETGRVWVLTDNAGLLTFDPRTRELQRYRNDRLTGGCHRICYDGDGKFWLGSINGLFRLDVRTGQVRSYSHDERLSPPRYNNICVLRRTSRGNLLVGTTLGVMQYDRLGDRFTALPLLDGVFVTDLIEDSGGDFWVGTYGNGLMRYDPQRELVTKHYVNRPGDSRSLPSDKVRSVSEDRIGRIWTTTFGGGFCLFDKQSDDFSVYNRSTLDMPLSNICYRIIEDDEGKLWVPSSRGLVCFTPETQQAKVYTTVDGLLNSEFDNHSSLRTEDGTIYFGSADGFIMFDPKKFYADKKIPGIVVTDLYIGDRVQRPGGKDSPLNCRIDRTRSVALSARQNSFGFGFALLGSASPAGNTVLCMLEGYDKEWVKASDDNTVFYSNIPAGRYTLRVKGVSGNGLWNDTHPPVVITVAQKFYKSTAAILAYVVLTMILVALCVHYLYRKALKREQTRQEEYARDREIELFDEKMAFFSNVVHEIKTPLTLIRAPMQNILASEECGEGIRDDLKIIGNSTDYLTKLVNELLDYVRLERHGYILDRCDIDLVEKIDFLGFNFSETAKGNRIALSFLHADEQVMISADESGLMKILYNLLHNAVKYAGSYIEVEMKCDGEHVVVSFRNDGNAIPQRYREDIFKPFVQYGADAKRYNNKGVGIGLSLARTIAELHGGTLTLSERTDCTEFILTLPLKQSQAGEPDADAEEIPGEGQHIPRVLVVEDNAELSAYMKRKLQPDYRVLVAPTAERALELLRRHEVDLVVTDIALGKMNGLELCKAVCSDFELSHIPVIVLSGFSTPKSKITAMEYGASLFIEKPFNLEYLQTCIKNLLDKRVVVKGAFQNSPLPLAPHLYNPPGSDAEFLRQLDSFIMANLSDPDLSNDQLAKAFYLSKSTLIRKIKGLLDTTPNDYIRNKRLMVAAQMLSNGQHRINEVCYSVGFNTPSYFAKCFRKHYGMLPAEYMEKRPEADLGQN